MGSGGRGNNILPAQELADASFDSLPVAHKAPLIQTPDRRLGDNNKDLTVTIDWIHFTPWSALAGGVLLGLASAAFILLNGRILGISGILAGLLTPQRGDAGWRIAFLLGMACAPSALALLFPEGTLVAPRIEAEYLGLVAAGLLVGVGTSCASGCTSGHGVCGLSRLSPRSLVATASFMAAGFVLVYVVRHAMNGAAA